MKTMDNWFRNLPVNRQKRLIQDKWMLAEAAFADQQKEINELKREMRRLVGLLDGECTMEDGSNADTLAAHILLGDVFIGKIT